MNPKLRMLLLSLLFCTESCPTLWNPHGLKLLCPWDFPGKNTGVSCHFLLQGIFPTQGSNLGLLNCKQILLLSEPPGMLLTSMCACSVASVMYDSLRLYGLQPTRLFCPWNSLGKNTRVGCHALLQGIFPTQGLNSHRLCLLCWQTGSLPLAPLGKPTSSLANIYFSDNMENRMDLN